MVNEDKNLLISLYYVLFLFISINCILICAFDFDFLIIRSELLIDSNRDLNLNNDF